MAKKITYSEAGVSIDANDEMVERISAHVKRTHGPRVIHLANGFAGLFRLDYDEKLFKKNYRNPVLVASTDGVGTKVNIATLMDRYDTIGIDLVAMSINDILVMGAEPLFFLDYIAVNELKPARIEQLVAGVSAGCCQADCALIGGETAEMPSVYQPGEFDLAGFVVGVVEKSKIIMGKDIALGDIILGLPSNGIHTNGYSLVRKIFGTEKKNLNAYYPELGLTLGEELLRPHRCYYKEIKPLLPLLKGIAHITGGGFVGNIPRVLPDGIAAKIQSKTWTVPPIFKMITDKGNVPLDEMYHVFNMGIGMVFIVSPSNVSHIKEALSEAIVIGETVKQPDNARVIIDGRGYRKDKVD